MLTGHSSRLLLAPMARVGRKGANTVECPHAKGRLRQDTTPRYVSKHSPQPSFARYLLTSSYRKLDKMTQSDTHLRWYRARPHEILDFAHLRFLLKTPEYLLSAVSSYLYDYALDIAPACVHFPQSRQRPTGKTLGQLLTSSASASRRT